MDDEEADLTSTQWAVIDRDVENKTRERGQEENGNRVEDVRNVELNNWPDDEFDDWSEAILNQTVEEDSEQHNNELNNNNNNGDAGVSSSHNRNQESLLTASQLELASAIFDDDENEPSLEHLECLRSKFHHSQFRQEQWEIINMVMNKKRDVLAVMATGYGKSLCFQFPAVFKNGFVLVVSPLIALMESQVMALEQLNIKACYVGRAQEDTQIYTKIARGEFNIIYCTPELLQSCYGTGKRMLNSIADRLMLVAIDGESFLLIVHFSSCHCIQFCVSTL